MCRRLTIDEILPQPCKERSQLQHDHLSQPFTCIPIRVMPTRNGWLQPQRLRLFQASHNLLEHLAAIIMPWVDILAGRLTDSDCALSMTDSTASEGWLQKTNFKEDSNDAIQAITRIEVAQKHAKLYMSRGIKEYSQWFPGEDNNVADAHFCD